MSSHQHNKVSRVGWLDFSIVTTIRSSSHPLFFVEFGKIRSGFSEILFSQVPRIEMEIPGGWGSYLFPSCLMLTSCPSLGKLLSFSSIQKAPINVDNSHGKVFEFRCYWKKYKK